MLQLIWNSAARGQAWRTATSQWQVGREARLRYGGANRIGHISVLWPMHRRCARQRVCAQRSPAAHRYDRHVLCTAKHQSQAEPPILPCQHTAGGRQERVRGRASLYVMAGHATQCAARQVCQTSGQPVLHNMSPGHNMWATALSSIACDCMLIIKHDTFKCLHPVDRPLQHLLHHAPSPACMLG